jgi:hypothetical protein
LSDELPDNLRPIVDFFGLPGTAAVAKDFDVVRAIRALAAIDAAPFDLVFGGGTALARAHRAVLVIAKLDRLARNAAFLLAIVDGAGPGGTVFCDLPEVPAGAVGKFFITLMAAAAELERGLISQRTKAAIAAAKARGVKLGGPNMGRGFGTAMSRAGHQAQTARAARHAADVLPYIAAARQAGAVTGAQIAAALTARGIRPPTGGESWHPNQVRRIERATRH